MLGGVAELITAKQRNGAIGTDYAMWHGASTRFLEPTPLEKASIFERMREAEGKSKSSRKTAAEWSPK